MKWFFVIVTVISCFCGCQNMTKSNGQHVHEWFEDNGRKKILTTTSHIKDLVKAIGGDYVDVIALIHGEQDPHSYMLVKGDDEKFARADLVFSNGLMLEHGTSLARMLEQSPRNMGLGNFLYEKDPSQIIVINKTLDPHIWMDVALWRQTVGVIANTLSTILSEHKDQIKKNAENVNHALDNLDKVIRAKMQSIPASKRYLVTTHDAFHYFAKRYMANEEEQKNGSWIERCQAPEGLAPDSQLSTADMQRMVEHLIKHHIHVVFAESNVSKDSIKKLISSCYERGHKVHIAKNSLFADAMGKDGTPQSTYIGMMLYNMEQIFSELEMEEE